MRHLRCTTIAVGVTPGSEPSARLASVPKTRDEATTGEEPDRTRFDCIDNDRITGIVIENVGDDALPAR
jgi:hypothetical protein